MTKRYELEDRRNGPGKPWRIVDTWNDTVYGEYDSYWEASRVLQLLLVQRLTEAI